MKASPIPLTAGTRRWRTALLAACSIMALAVFIEAFEGSPIMPWSSTTMGLRAEYATHKAGVLVTNVARNGPAGTAGMRAGDRIDFSDIAFRERWRMRDVIRGWGGLAGEHLKYVAHRGSQIIVAIVRPRHVAPSWPTWMDWLSYVAAFWGLFFAGILAARRPDLVEARLLSLILLSFLGLSGMTGLFAPWPIAEFPIHMLGGSFFLAVPSVCLTILASRVARPLSIVRRVLAVTAVAFAAATAATGVVWYIGWFALALPVYWAWRANYIDSVALAASLLSAIGAMVAARGAERARLFWIVASLAIIWLYYIFSGLVDLLDPRYYYYFYSVESYLLIPFTLALLSLPVALTYAVLSRRIVDIGYVLNKAVVFSGVSIVLVGLFMLGEWLIGSWLGRVSHATNLTISAGLVLALGFSVRTIHSRVERVLDRAFFRKRHDDEMAIRNFAEQAAEATDANALVRETMELLETRADAQFVMLAMDDRRGRYGDVDENDPAIVALHDRHNPLDLKTLSTQVCGEFAYPMIAHGRLIGALVLGPKHSGDNYAPDESQAIMQLAREVGGALRILNLEKVLEDHHLPA